MNKLLYTTQEAAEILSICVPTVRLLVAHGYLPVRRIGRLKLIHRKDIETLAKVGVPSVWKSGKWRR